MSSLSNISDRKLYLSAHPMALQILDYNLRGGSAYSVPPNYRTPLNAEGALAASLQTVPEILREEGFNYVVYLIDMLSISQLQLGPEDWLIVAEVTEHDFGSQLVRYFMTIVSIFGIGACKLRVRGQIWSGKQGYKMYELLAQQGMGLFGGSGEKLMKQNVKSMGVKMAKQLVSMNCGRNFLNRNAYQCAIASLVLGITALIPIIGFALSLGGIVCGAIAASVISQRNLQKRKTIAVIGLVISVLTFFFNIWFAANL